VAGESGGLGGIRPHRSPPSSLPKRRGWKARYPTHFYVPCRKHRVHRPWACSLAERPEAAPSGWARRQMPSITPLPRTAGPTTWRLFSIWPVWPKQEAAARGQGHPGSGHPGGVGQGHVIVARGAPAAGTDEATWSCLRRRWLEPAAL